MEILAPMEYVQFFTFTIDLNAKSKQIFQSHGAFGLWFHVTIFVLQGG